MTRILILALVPLALVACGDDIAAPVTGTFIGDIVSGSVVETGYTVTVTAVDKDTLSIAGADFATFQVDLMVAGGVTTNLASDTANQLSYSDDALSFNHTGADTVQFSGVREGTDTNADADTDADADSDTDADSDSDTDADASSMVAGGYTGSISGPVNAVDYPITLAIVDANTVSVTGADFTTFNIPLSTDGSTVSQAGTWTSGAFTWDAGDLNLMYTPQGLSFAGTHD